MTNHRENTFRGDSLVVVKMAKARTEERERRNCLDESATQGDEEGERLGLLSKQRGIMKILKLVILIAAIAMTLFLLLPNLSWACDEGNQCTPYGAMPLMRP